jgi:hypothetical protein
MDEFCYDFENESGNNDVMGTVVTEDKAKASTYESSPTAIVVCEDGKMTVNVFSGSTYSARNKNVDTDESCYIFGSYLSDETANVENVHVSETDSKVGNTVACSDMSGSLSGSLSDETITVRGRRSRRERNPPKTEKGHRPEERNGHRPEERNGRRPKERTGADPKNGRAPTQRPATAIHHRRREGVRWFLKRPTSQGPSEETAGRRSPSSGPTLEKWGDVWTSRLNCG